MTLSRYAGIHLYFIVNTNTKEKLFSFYGFDLCGWKTSPASIIIDIPVIRYEYSRLLWKTITYLDKIITIFNLHPEATKTIMKTLLTITIFSLLLQCKNSVPDNAAGSSGEDTTETEMVSNNQSENNLWLDTSSTAATAKAGEYELDHHRTVWIDYDRFFDLLLAAPAQEEANDNNRLNISLPLPYDETHEFAMLRVEVMAPELAEKYPQIKTYEGRSTTDPVTSIRLDFGDHGANYMIIKDGEQIFMEPLVKGQKDIYIIYNKKDVKKYPIDFEKPGR